MDINNILLDLEIIKQIKENEKLGIHIVPGNSKLFVDNSVYFSSIKRWYNGYNREDSIKYLEDLVVNIYNISDLIISGSHNELSINLKNAIINALPGLNKLKNTYNNDSISVAKIVLIINKLNKIVENLQEIDLLPSYKDMEHISLSMINNIEKENINNNEPSNNEPTNNEPSNNERTNNEPTNNERTNNEPTNNELTNNELTNNELTNNDSNKKNKNKKNRND